MTVRGLRPDQRSAVAERRRYFLADAARHRHGKVDVDRCRRLIELCRNRVAVFHRAFDLTPDPLQALEVLIDLGFHRVMTSGQAQSALEGIELIARLIERAAGTIDVMPAGGIRPMNVI